MAYLSFTECCRLTQNFGYLFLSVLILSAFLKVQNVHFLDASSQEEAAVPLRVLVIFLFEGPDSPYIQATRMLGNGELQLDQIKELIQVRGYFQPVFDILIY